MKHIITRTFRDPVLDVISENPLPYSALQFLWYYQEVLKVSVLSLQSIFSKWPLNPVCLREGEVGVLVLVTTGKWTLHVSRGVHWLSYMLCPWIYSLSSCCILPNVSNTIVVPATFHHYDKVLEMKNIKITLAHGLRFFNPWLFGHLVYAECKLSIWLSGQAEHHGQESMSRVWAAHFMVVRSQSEPERKDTEMRYIIQTYAFSDPLT